MSSPPDAQAKSELWRDPNFRWLTAGGALSMLGDQFTLLALPWLVLRMSGDTRVLGIVLALVSVPRAAFILLGGAVVDRYSPKQVLMITKYVNTVLLGALAALVFSGHIALWMVYGLALGIGLATAFSIPSGTSMMPHVLAPRLLPAANGITLGLRQLSMFAGPLLAGLLIALSGDGSRDGSGSMANANGIGLAFAFDALSFAVSAWTLAKVRMLARAPAAHASPPGPPPAVFSSVVQGLAHVWRDVELRACFAYWGAVALLIMGPVHIALPVLASTAPQLGAAALGGMIGAHGAGTLAGMVAAGVLPRVRIGSLGLTVLVFDIVIGALFMPLGSIHSAWQGVALLATIGVLGGYMQVAVFTWIQQRVPPQMMGRTMSLFMFIFMGLVPMSAAVTGWLMRALPLAQLFVVCGALLMLVALVALVASPMRQVRDAVPRAA